MAAWAAEVLATEAEAGWAMEAAAGSVTVVAAAGSVTVVAATGSVAVVEVSRLQWLGTASTCHRIRLTDSMH